MSCARDHLTAIWKKLDKVHIHVRAMRIITGATKRSNINSCNYEDLGWVSPSRRRLITGHPNGPQYLADIVPPTVGDRQIHKVKGHRPDIRTCRDNVTQNHSFLQPYVNGTRFQ